MRMGRQGRRPAGRIRTARPARACSAAALAAVLLAGCGTAPLVADTNVTVPTPEPATSLAPPSGKPLPVPTSSDCLASVPAMSPIPKPGHMPAGSTMAAIQKRGYLIAGVDQDSYDWGYPNPSPNPASGESYLGFDIDVLHALAHAIFGDPDKIHFVPVTQDFRMGAANLGIVDVVADSITITCAREKQVHFSIDYINAAQELLVPRDNTTISVTLNSQRVPQVNGLAGGKVCTVGTTTSVQNLTALAKADGFSVVLADNWSDCLVLLQQGDVQAFSTDDTILGGIEAEDPYLRLAGAPFSFEPHGLAFPLDDPYSKKDTEFISFANGVLLSLESHANGYCPELLATDGTCWGALYRTWVKGQLPGTTAVVPTPTFSG
jgi:polar amino acid transport system substrate-binding protein